MSRDPRAWLVRKNKRSRIQDQYTPTRRLNLSSVCMLPKCCTPFIATSSVVTGTTVARPPPTSRRQLRYFLHIAECRHQIAPKARVPVTFSAVCKELGYRSSTTPRASCRRRRSRGFSLTIASHPRPNGCRNDRSAEGGRRARRPRKLRSADGVNRSSSRTQNLRDV